MGDNRPSGKEKFHDRKRVETKLGGAYHGPHPG